MRRRNGWSRSLRVTALAALAPIAALVGAPVAAPVAAQGTASMRAGVAAPLHAELSADTVRRVTAGTALFGPAVRSRVSPRVSSAWTQWSPVASAIAPGTGQFMLGNDRFVAYAAIEAITWFAYFKDQRDQTHQEAAFKDIARRVARAHFSATLPDSSWSYYEAMRDYLESGVYSETDVGPVVPETDTTTYNGFKWLIELRTHGSAAEALSAYERDAIRPEYRWSWRNAQLQYDLYARTTEKRNSAFHNSARDLMILGANHVLSMIDAFATVRLTVTATASGGTALGARVPW